MNNIDNDSSVKTVRNKNSGGGILEPVKWVVIVFFIITTIFGSFKILPTGVGHQIPLVFLMIFAWIHGPQRYGFKNMFVWFIITTIVSTALESLSIHTGFPFGHYYYTLPGLRIGGVPILFVPLIYFAIGYTCWTVAQVVTGHFGSKLSGMYRFVIPFTAGLVMTMWDLCIDPFQSTINSSWIWINGGDYYGVPVTNFAGWVFVVYLFMQIFTLYMSNKSLDISKDNVTSSKTYWLEAVIVYSVLGISVLLNGFLCTDHIAIYTCMAMISVFTMLFTAGISLLNIKRGVTNS